MNLRLDEYEKANFDQLKDAVSSDRIVCIKAQKRTNTGGFESVTVICTIDWDNFNHEFKLKPFAELLTTNDLYSTYGDKYDLPINTTVGFYSLK